MGFDDVDKISVSSSRVKEEGKVEARSELELGREMPELDIFGAEMEAVVVETALSDCEPW